MRNLPRPRVKLPTLTAIDQLGEGWKATGVDVPADDQWNNPDVRGALYAMHGRSCAYCQRSLPGNDRGDVEHFRPKSKYPWLKYDFNNYFLSCSLCNRVRKRSKFPLAEGDASVTYENRAQLPTERHILLNPADENVESWIDFDFTDRLYPIVPKSGIDRLLQARIKQTVEFFRLNSDTTLLTARMETVGEALELIEQIRNGDVAKIAELQDLANKYRPHGIVVRKLLESAKRDDLLPPHAHDLRGLVSDLLEELTPIDLVRAANPPPTPAVERDLRRAEDEILWALAVLLKAPPVSSADEIGAWIGGRRKQAAVFSAQL
jgi:uncharacterized protein (TIGR02646 family)